MTKFRYPLSDSELSKVPRCPGAEITVAANYLGSFVAKSAKNFPA